MIKLFEKEAQIQKEADAILYSKGLIKNSIIIGEDSILSIDALNGFPGVKTI